MKLTDLYEKMEQLQNNENIEFGILGSSALGLPVYLVHIGKKEGDQIIVEAGIHAREYITTLVAVEQIKHLSQMFLDFGIYFVMCANPDGAGLVLDGRHFSCPGGELMKKLISINKSDNFEMWKANINCVDCNVNFDALWGHGKSNIRQPAGANFIGFNPNSEIEVQNLIELTRQIKPVLTLSYHTKGNVIYYGFEVLTKNQIKRDLFIAKQLAKINGFKPIKTYKSTGGYSDFVSQNFGVPSFTVEFGKDSLKHPIGQQYLDELLKNNLEIPLICHRALKKWETNNKT